MINQNPDDSLTKEPGQRQLSSNKQQGYYAAVPAELLDSRNTIIDEVISFAFDTLGARRLHVRVYDQTAA